MLVVFSLALSALLATWQFSWLDEVEDDSKRTAMQLLRVPMHGVSNALRDELESLLWTFGPDADLEPSIRLESYWDRYLRWHAMSRHGPAVKRILFYEMPSDGSRGLTELLVEPRGITSADWSEDLARLRAHIDEFGFAPGRRLAGDWSATWVFQLRPLAIYRPIVTRGTEDRDGLPPSRLSGYLILVLDLDYLRDELIPQIVSGQLGHIDRNAKIQLAFEHDQEGFLVYEPATPARPGPAGLANPVRMFSPVPTARHAAPEWLARPRLHIDLPVSTRGVSEAATRRGAVQRVAFERKRQPPWNAVPPRLGAEPGSDSAFAATASATPAAFRETGIGNQPPQLFVAGESPYLLQLGARFEGTSMAELVNQRYGLTTVVWTVAILLLVAVMAMVARSELRTAREAARRADVMASLTHQLRKPLEEIARVGDDMARGAEDTGATVASYGRKLRGSVRALTEILDRSARTESLESSAGPAKVAMVDVSQIARDAFEAARPAIEAQGFLAESSLVAGLPLVMADTEALRQSLDELLGNAIKYGLPGRWLRIETAAILLHGATEVQVRVRDRGCGISPPDREKVFAPYYRAPEVADSQITGTGLGLALARDAIEEMGGKLSLDSEEGRGSVFTIHLPVPN